VIIGWQRVGNRGEREHADKKKALCHPHDHLVSACGGEERPGGLRGGESCIGCGTKLVGWAAGIYRGLSPVHMRLLVYYYFLLHPAPALPRGLLLCWKVSV
jgi:hypothetical protein